MSATQFIQRQRVTTVGEESSFGVTPAGSFPNAMTAIATTHDTVDVDSLSVEVLDVMDERIRRNATQQPQLGLQIGSKVTFGGLIKWVPTGSLVTGSSIPSLSHRLLYRHHFGAEGCSYGTTSSGTTIAGATTITGQAGWGAHVVVGSWLAIVTSSGLEVRKVISVSTDTVTLHAGLIGSTSNAAVIRGLFTYSPADSHTSTLTWQRAFVGDSNAQYTISGCAGSLKFTLPIGKLATWGADFMATSFVGPSAQSLSTAAQTDDMDVAVLTKGTLYLSSASGVSFSGTAYSWQSAEIVHTNAWEQIRDGGATQTVAGYRDKGGRPRAAQLKLRLFYDATASTGLEALWTGQAGVNATLVLTYGSGATARVWAVEFPNAVLVAKPKPVKGEGELLYMEVEFNALEDVTVGAVSATPQKGTHSDIANAVLRLIVG
jgi:hypothetical protein